jgi:hypothetical protein
MRRFARWAVALALAGCGSVSNETANADAHSCVPSPAGLKARWRGDMSTTDETGVYDGITSGTYTPAGRHGSAFLFDGTQTFTADANDDLWPSSSFSLEAWVEAPSAQGTSAMVVEKYDCGGLACRNSEYLFEIYGTGEPVFQYRTADMTTPLLEVASFTKVTDGRWHHLVGVRDVGNAQQRFYVDGVLVAANRISDAALGALSNQDMESDPVTIGAGRSSSQTNPTLFFRGAVDEVAIYFSALDDAQVAAIYAAPDGICPSM